MFCPHCGSPVDELPGSPATSEPVEVILARIEHDKAIELAKINARQERDWNESRETIAAIEGEAEVESATAEAAVIGAVIAASDEPVPEPEPIVIDAPIVGDDQGDDEELPPVEGTPPPGPKHKAAGIGFW